LFSITVICISVNMEVLMDLLFCFLWSRATLALLTMAEMKAETTLSVLFCTLDRWVMAQPIRPGVLP
jgi:hypothetical protein